jgi:hypothetical protein
MTLLRSYQAWKRYDYTIPIRSIELTGSKNIARNHGQVMETDQSLQNFHENAVRRNQDIESAQLASWKQVSTQAGAVEKSLQSVVQWELPAIDRFLQNYIQHLKNFTEILSEGNAALESHITKNNEKLERQAEIIAQVQTLGSADDLTKWASFFIIMVLLRSLSPQMTTILGGLTGTFIDQAHMKASH